MKRGLVLCYITAAAFGASVMLGFVNLVGEPVYAATIAGFAAAWLLAGQDREFR
jgi:hypothetical protein